MKSFCVRGGQVEVGVIEHEGHEFAALGATVMGRHVTAYTRRRNGSISLTTWCGETMLDARCEVVERFWSGGLALIFRLTGRRFIVGYALGEEGCLFRGELLPDCSDEDARRAAIDLAELFAELDIEDEIDGEITD